MRLVCLSDTHNFKTVSVPHGDILIHAGDFTENGGVAEIAAFNAWLGTLPHRYKIVVAGNHDRLFEEQPALAEGLLTDCIYLRDREVQIEGLRIYGSPWQPEWANWAFNVPRGPEIAAKWALIPSGIDVLITHGPPLGQCDAVERVNTDTGGWHKEQLGCEDLLEAVRRVRPRYHVFGHIHEGHGVSEEGDTHFINASIRDGGYRPINLPSVVDVTDVTDVTARNSR